MPDGHNFRYPRATRVRRESEIRVLLGKGSRTSDGPVEVYRLASRIPRAGIVVPRFGHTIVERNRLKRHLREWVRLEWLPAARKRPAEEILVRVRREAYGVEPEELRSALQRCTGGVP